MMNNRHSLYGLSLTLLILISLSVGYAQSSTSVSLDSCIALAQRNYPQIQQYELIQRSREYSLSNAQKATLPQISISGKATYQSDVTSLPGGEALGAPELSKDQYQLYGEVVQPLTGLTTIKTQKEIIEASSDVEEADLATKLYKVKERVSSLFFGILLIESQLTQSELTRSDIDSGLARVEASARFGVLLQSNVDVLKAELLSLEQRIIEQEAAKQAYTEMLSLFIDRELDENTEFITPQDFSLTSEINRPELSVFNANMKSIGLQQELIDKSNLPQFNLFLQSGVGRPALNFLSNDFEPYYIGGLSLSWNLSSFYTSGKQKKILALNEQILKSEKETFLFNTQLDLGKQNIEILKMEELIQKDLEIIALRDKVIKSSKNQLQNGVITPSEYKSVVIDADLARQKLAQHQIELLQLKNQHLLISGN